MFFNVLMPFTYVRYTGSKLSAEIGNRIGEVVKHMPTGGYVVDFGADSYVIADGNLVQHFFNESSEKKGPEIVRRRRYEADDE